ASTPPLAPTSNKLRLRRRRKQSATIRQCPTPSPSIWRTVCNVNDGENSFGRDYGRRLDFNLCALLQQTCDNDQRHRRKMSADDPAIGLSDFLLPRHIGCLVGHEPGQPRQMVRLAARFGKHLHDVRKRAFDLRDKIVTDKLATLAPADLTSNEYLASLSGHAIGIPLGRRPVFWLKKF